MRSDSNYKGWSRGVFWIWFDLDDTLIDFHANSRSALRLLYEQEGLASYYATCEEWIGAYECHNHKLWDRYNRGEITQDFLRLDRFRTPLNAGWGGTVDELDAYCLRLDPLYLGLLAAQTAMVDGAVELVESLRDKGYNIGVLSNGFTDVQNRKLVNTGLDRIVDLMVLSDDIGVNKPDPRLFVHAMSRTADMEPSHHLMIGDNPDTDIAGAVRSGWRAIHLDRRLGAGATLSEEKTHLVSPSLDLLMELF